MYVSVGVSVGVGVSRCMCVRGEKILGCSVGVLAVDLEAMILVSGCACA